MPCQAYRRCGSGVVGAARRAVARQRSQKPPVESKLLESRARDGDSPVDERPATSRGFPEYSGTRATLEEFRRTTSEG